MMRSGQNLGFNKAMVLDTNGASDWPGSDEFWIWVKAFCGPAQQPEFHLPSKRFWAPRRYLHKCDLSGQEMQKEPTAPSLDELNEPNDLDMVFINVQDVASSSSTAPQPPLARPVPQVGLAPAQNHIRPPPPRRRHEPITTGQWAAGLCDCFDSCIPNCCMSCWCPCVTLAQVAFRMRLMSFGGALGLFGLLLLFNSVISWAPSTACERAKDGTKTNGDCWVANVSFVVLLVSWTVQTLVITSMRGKIRRRFQIAGNAVGDCLVSCCCTCCAAAQMATHVKSYQPGDCSFAAPDQLAAYTM